MIQTRIVRCFDSVFLMEMVIQQLYPALVLIGGVVFLRGLFSILIMRFSKALITVAAGAYGYT